MMANGKMEKCMEKVNYTLSIGTYYYSDQTKFEGNFENSKKSGKGKDLG